MGYPGRLHRLIEEGKWEGVLELVSNDTSASEEMKVPYRDSLPIHMVCEKRAPDGVILAILRAFPDAARSTGRGGNLPLHIATHRNLSTDVIESLIREHPEALDEMNKSNFTPRNIGHSDIVAFQALRR